MLSAATLLSHYEFISLAGSGGTGEVYLALEARALQKAGVRT